MARSGNQKLKLLYLARYLHECTDEEHPATVAELISFLSTLDIKAERKAIYDDMEALFGVFCLLDFGGMLSVNFGDCLAGTSAPALQPL